MRVWATVCKTLRPMLWLSDRNVGVLSPNGWTDQDETWHACRPRLRPHSVTWGPSSPSPIGAQPPQFSAHLLLPNGCMDQDATWYGGRPRHRRFCVRWGPALLSKKGADPQFFGPRLLRPNGWMDETGTWQGRRTQPR